MIVGKNIMFSLIIAVVLSYCIDVINSLPSMNTDDKCDIWAQEGECVFNPNFMWSSCHSSCMSFARDDDERCNNWALEGECTNNPGFMQVHCPVACSRQIGWNVWIRHQLNMQDELPFHDGVVSELRSFSVNDLLDIVKLMYQRLDIFLSGGHLMVDGLATSAPTPFLGVSGISEAFIYTLRLIHVIVASYESKYDLSDNKDEHLIWKEHLLNVKHRIENFIVDIDHNLSQNEVDGLGRFLPTWAEYLSEILAELEQGITGAADKNISSVETLKISNILNVEPYDRMMELYKSKDKVGEIHSHITLSNGVNMPIIGMGTWQLEGESCSQVVIDAISKYNYRFIDTAEAYRNEKEIGEAIATLIKDKVIERKDIFIATKLSDEEANGGYTKTTAFIKNQMKLLQVDYIDLYMLHSPFRDVNMQHNSWKAIEDMYIAGQLKSIGVSNFNSDELYQLVAKSKIKPMVLQNKADIYHVGKQMDTHGDNVLDIARLNNITVIAYSPLSAYPFVMKPSYDPILQYIANEKTKRLASLTSILPNKEVEKTSSNSQSATEKTVEPPPVKIETPKDPNVTETKDTITTATNTINKTNNTIRNDEDEFAGKERVTYTPPKQIPKVDKPAEEDSKVGDVSRRRLSEEVDSQATVKVSASQVALRWLMQHNIAVIPRSASSEHLKENMDVVMLPELALTKEEMAIIDSIQYLVESQISVAVPIDHV